MRVCATALLVCSLLLNGAAHAGERVASHSTDASAVVLRYEEVLPVGGESGPSLTVYGDGRAVVHTPGYMKNAGDYETRLSPAELKNLIEGLAADGVIEFDPVEAKRKLSLQRRARSGVASGDSDPSVTDIELNLSRYVSPDGVEKTGLSKRLRAEGLRERTGDAVPELRDLGRAQRRCRAIMERGDLEEMR